MRPSPFTQSRSSTAAWLAALALLGLFAVARADLADDLSSPKETPQLRGLGVSTHWGRNANWDIDIGLPLMKQMGVHYIRDVFKWTEVEKSKGEYAMYPAAQHWWDAVNGANIRVMAVLHYGNKLYENPLDPDGFANYAGWMAKNYKGKVAAWEIWNEPVNFEFYKKYGGNRDGSNEAPWIVKYSEFVRKAAAAIKAADPDAVVLHNNEGLPWQNALKTHASDYAQVDGVDLHPYPTDPAKKGVEHIYPGLDKNSNLWPTDAIGRRLQCWVGECGMSTWTPKEGAMIHFHPVTEALQAAGEIRTLVKGLVYGVKAWCIYDFIDESANPQDVESNFGLVRDITHKHEPKPAFYALQRLAKLLGPDWQSLPELRAELKVEDGISDAEKQQEMHWFKVGNNFVTVLWQGGPSDVVKPPASGQLIWNGAPQGARAEGVDLVTGKAVSLEDDGKGAGLKLSHVPVGWAPVAIRWTFAGGAAPNEF